MDKLDPGIYQDLSNEAYHGHHGSYSKSSLSDFNKYPYNLIWQRLHPKERDKFNLGTACHTAILEIEKWEEEIVVIPPDVLSKSGSRAGNKWKEWRAAQDPKKTIITEGQRDQVLRVWDSVFKNPYHSEAAKYVSGGYSEVTAVWEEPFLREDIDEDTGYRYLRSYQYGDTETENLTKLLLKVRPDHIPWPQVVTDLKTTAIDISDDDALLRNCYAMKYHWSAALTLRGMTLATEQTTGKHIPHRDYYFVFVEVGTGKAPVPHAVRVVRATQEFIAMGRLEIMHAMERLAWCVANNKWPWMPNRVAPLDLPPYVFRKLFQRREEDNG